MHILHHKENVFYPDIHAQSTQGPKKGCILSSTSGGGDTSKLKQNRNSIWTIRLIDIWDCAYINTCGVLFEMTLVFFVGPWTPQTSPMPIDTYLAPNTLRSPLFIIIINPLSSIFLGAILCIQAICDLVCVFKRTSRFLILLFLNYHAKNIKNKLMYIDYHFVPTSKFFFFC